MGKDYLIVSLVIVPVMVNFNIEFEVRGLTLLNSFSCIELLYCLIGFFGWWLWIFIQFSVFFCEVHCNFFNVWNGTQRALFVKIFHCVSQHKLVHVKACVWICARNWSRKVTLVAGHVLIVWRNDPIICGGLIWLHHLPIWHLV